MAAIYSSSVYRAISMSLNAYGVQLDDPSDDRFAEADWRTKWPMKCSSIAVRF